MAINIENNYKNLKDEFKSDTKLDPDKNMELFLQYSQMRSLDVLCQIGIAIHNTIKDLSKHG